MDSWLGLINPQLHCLRTIPSNQGLIGLYKMACVFKGRINPQSHCPCNLKEVAAFYVRNKLNYTQVNVGAKTQPPTA